MLGDMRPQPYPAEAVDQMRQMAKGGGGAGAGAGLGAKAAAPPKMTAFSGSGYTLGGSSSSSAAAAASAEPSGGGGSSSGGGGEGGAWPTAEAAVPQVDAGAPTTEVQVRLAGAPPQRFKLNRSHTVGDLKCLVERTLASLGEAPRRYTLAAGFPPKPLTDDALSLEQAGLVNAAVVHRWA